LGDLAETPVITGVYGSFSYSNLLNVSAATILTFLNPIAISIAAGAQNVALRSLIANRTYNALGRALRTFVGFSAYYVAFWDGPPSPAPAIHTLAATGYCKILNHEIAE
jgi:hypothetical protein